jgi:L-alanine-DL-glutamate epimerase-like enolase superfamily enzyme
MEITDLRAYTLRPPLSGELGDARASVAERYWVVVELDTDTGLTGTGWIGTWTIPDLYERYVHEFADLLVGSDPLAVEARRRELRERALYYPGEVGFAALPRSAIDVALWDLKAQAAGLPLYALLGGDGSPVPAYCSRLDATVPTGEIGAHHVPYAEAGFTAFKTKVGGRSLEEDVARVGAIREAVGSRVELFVDANQSWTVSEAVRGARALAEHDVGWVEEPISEWDLDGHRRVADRMDAPLATGEMFYRPERFEWLLSRGGLGVAQPDLLRGGGVSALREVAGLAATHHVPFVPHIHHEVSAHLVNAAPTGVYVEYIPEYDVSGVLENAPEIRDGAVLLPDAPGHGYSVRAEAREEFGVSFD